MPAAKTQINILVDVKLTEALSRVASRTGRPVSHVAQDAILLYLVNHSMVSERIEEILREYLENKLGTGDAATIGLD